MNALLLSSPSFRLVKTDSAETIGGAAGALSQLAAAMRMISKSLDPPVTTVGNAKLSVAR